MGQLTSRFVSLIRIWRNKPYKILILGLDGAGKTTVLYWIRSQTAVITVPTVGLNVEEVCLPKLGINFVAWDIGGQEKLRKFWSRFYEDTKGLIYVIDSSDTDRMNEASNELVRVMNDPNMNRVPFIVLANKQDLSEALTLDDLAQKLRLNDLTDNGHDWKIKPGIATKGIGILDAFIELGQLIRRSTKK